MTTQQSGGFVGCVLFGRWRAILALAAIALASFRMPASSMQKDDSPEIRAVVERFFAAYGQEDLSAIMALWNDKSPEAAPAREIFEKTFSAVKTIRVRDLRIVKVEKRDDQAATVRVAVETEANDAATGKAARGFGRLNRCLYLVYEIGAWKIQRYVSSEEDLAQRIGGAKTDEERKALVSANQELETADLDKALVAEGRQLLRQGRY